MLSHFHAHGYPDLEFDGPPTHLSGGFWAEMWTLHTVEGTRAQLPAQLVLRFAPDAQLAVWETAFQSGVAEQGYPTPKIRGFDFQPEPNRRPWCVMDYADGTPLLSGLNGLRAFAALPRLATGLPDTLARAAVALHRLDPQPVETALREASGRAIGIDSMLDRLLAASRALADSSLERLIERLAATKPSRSRRVVCHGDLHPFNVLTTTSGYVVLDWTSGQIADPAYDLAFTHLLVANPPLVAPQPLRPIINAVARRLADRFIRTYDKVASYDVGSDALDWYRTLHACRILIDLAAWRADGSLDAHRGHPWFALEPTLLPLLG